MRIIIQKYGGTSLENTERIKIIARKIKAELAKGNKLVIIVSAMAGYTNKFAGYCADISAINNQSRLAEYDVALSSGEIMSAALLALALQELDIKARSCQAWQIPIRTNDRPAQALIEDINSDYFLQCFAHDIVPIVTGFQGVNQFGRINTLGRGGSDTTAVAIAAAMQAELCEIYTDVDGVYNSDPRIVKNARKIRQIDYAQMLEFASLGAKVLHSRAVQIAERYNIDIMVRSSFNDEPGSLITNQENIMEKTKITGIAYDNKIALVQITELDNITALFAILAEHNIIASNINKTQIDKAISVSFTINLVDLSRLQLALSHNGIDFIANEEVAIVSVIGYALKQESQICYQALQLIQDMNIEIFNIFTSEIKLSFLIALSDMDQLIKKLYNIYDLEIA